MPYSADRHGPQRLVGPGFRAAVQALVEQVPRGAVTTFGDLAAALGSRSVARHVGWALAALPPAATVPWWRVVGADGRLPQGERQAMLLRAEGLQIDGGRVAAFARHRHSIAAAPPTASSVPPSPSRPMRAP